MLNNLPEPSAKYFRYLSATKVNRLICRDSPVSSGGISILGVGGSLSRTSPSLRQRLDSVLEDLRHSGELGNLGSPSSNFIAGKGTFVEYLMKEVVIWIGQSDTTTVLLGGSSRFLNFDNFGKDSLSGVKPGSNRTAILNALTTLWRTAEASDVKAKITDPRAIEFWDTFYGSIDGRQVTTQSHDDIPYPLEAIVPKSVAEYLREARAAYSLCPDYLIDELEYAAIVYTDYTFREDDERARSCETPIRSGDRIVIGSPLYVAQLAPSGNLHIRRT